jgi:hypothetical protein
VPNQITSELREMILGALAAKGGQAYLEQQADENPTAFLTLLGKILPRPIEASLELRDRHFISVPMPPGEDIPEKFLQLLREHAPHICLVRREQRDSDLLAEAGPDASGAQPASGR